MQINKEQIEDFEFAENNNIQFLRVGEDVLRIGEKAFYKCPNLISVKIEESDTPIKICSNAFSGCKHLVEIEIKRKSIFYKKFKHGRKL